MKLFKEKEEQKGIIGTVTVHAIILMLFILLGLTHQVPLPEAGVEASLGYMEIGSGDEAPATAEDVSKPQPEPEQTPIEPVESTEPVNDAPSEMEDILTDDNSDVAVEETPEPVVKTKEKAEPVEEVKEQVEVKEQQRVEKNLEDLLAKVKSKTKDKTTDGTGVGSSTQPGVQGDPSGSGNENGKSNFKGIGFELGDRTAKLLPRPKSSIQEAGKVIVDIKVDKYGNVTWAKAGARGSTITNQTQFKEAEAAAYKAKFSVDVKAVGEQKGTITYNFVLN